MSNNGVNTQYTYFLSFVGISDDKLNVGDIVCEIFLMSFIFLLAVLMTVDTTCVDKSSTLKEGANGNTIDIVIGDRINIWVYSVRI